MTLNVRSRSYRPTVEVLEPRCLLAVNKEVLAFYYPWYGNPQVSGHYVHWQGVDDMARTIDNATHYPELGAYDSHDPAVVAQHVGSAVQSGITGFISSWWGPGTFEDHSLPLLLDAARGAHLEITAYFEQVRGTTPTRESALADVLYLLNTYGNDPAWLRVDGKPVLFVYSRAVNQIGLSDWQWVIAQTNGTYPGGAAFIGDQISDAAAGVFDGLHTYNVTGSTANKTPAQIQAWAQATYPGWVATAQRHDRISTLTVIPGFDDSKLNRPPPRPITDRYDGVTYSTLWQAAIAADPDWILLTSWNEWHEGSEIEPSDENGHRELATTAQFAAAFFNESPPAAPLHATATAGNGLVTVSWAAPSGPVRSYNVYRATTPGGEGSTPVAAGVWNTAFTDTGLTNGTTYYYVVTAVNGAGPSSLSNEAAATPQAADAFSVSVNFSNNLTEVPTGYVTDLGLAFGDRGNGFRFGWNQDNTANARDRDNPNAPDERYDSFAHMQKPSNPDASWRIALPNGTYAVHLVAGDIDDHFDAVYAIDVQGALAVSGTPTPGNKVFEGTVTVTVTDGLLTVSNDAQGTNNKIDFIDIFQVAPDVVDFAGGFAGATGLRLNAGALVSGARLRLTDGGQFEGRSAFLNRLVNVQQFTNDFRFQLTNAAADGFTFTLQGVDPAVVGGVGGSLGYAGIGTSVAVKFDLYDNLGEGPDSTGLYTSGSFPGVAGSVDLRGTGIDLHSGHVFNVHMAYDGTTLTVRITDETTGASATQNYSVDVPGAVGGPLAYAGFTAGTGGLTAVQDILSWTFTPTGGAGGGAGSAASTFFAAGTQAGKPYMTALAGIYFFAQQPGWYPEGNRRPNQDYRYDTVPADRQDWRFNRVPWVAHFVRTGAPVNNRLLNPPWELLNLSQELLGDTKIAGGQNPDTRF
jgi:glycoprotein endo-alpha-1,2-mannosidase